MKRFLTVLFTIFLIAAFAVPAQAGRVEDEILILRTTQIKGAGSDGDIDITDPLQLSLLSCGGSAAIALGGGTEALPMTTSEANKNFIEFRGESTATAAGSDSRLAYMRLYLNGATTGGGEAARIFTTVEKSVGTARGAHISLNYGASGATSGLGTATTGTLHLPNTGTVTGNVAAVQAEMYCDSGDDDDVTIPDNHGLLRLSVSGDAGVTQSVKNAIHITGTTAVDGGTDLVHMLTTGVADMGLATNLTAALRIRIGSTTYWVPLATSIAAD